MTLAKTLIVTLALVMIGFFFFYDNSIEVIKSKCTIVPVAGNEHLDCYREKRINKKTNETFDINYTIDRVTNKIHSYDHYHTIHIRYLSSKTGYSLFNYKNNRLNDSVYSIQESRLYRVFKNYEESFSLKNNAWIMTKKTEYMCDTIAEFDAYGKEIYSYYNHYEDGKLVDSTCIYKGNTQTFKYSLDSNKLIEELFSKDLLKYKNE